MKDLVYKFLDNYLGDEIVCEPHCMEEWYIICSKKNAQRILKFFVRNKRGVKEIRLFREVSLCYKVSGYCGIDNVEDCTNYIKTYISCRRYTNSRWP